MQMTIKKKIFEIIDPSHAYDDTSKTFNVSMLALIFLNVVAVILETEAGLYSRYKAFCISLSMILSQMHSLVSPLLCGGVQ